MKQETLEEAAVIYAHKSFVWPLNKQGEKQSIPPGQIVPSGYAKHQKVATKHFTNGAKWQIDKQDDFAIGFAEWLEKLHWKIYYNTTAKELLEIYKKEKGNEQ